jgi:serine/threonine-protein kinase
MKLRLIVGLVSGLNYLHKNGIVHRGLKPNDLIIESDGTVRICGYATRILEDHKYTKASQVGGTKYMAPEIYDDEGREKKNRDPRSDVFSFGFLLFEILTGERIFRSTMTDAAIMRKAQSDRREDRPDIPSDMDPILRNMISRS